MRRKFTENEIEFVKANYGKITIFNIGNKLNRSSDSIAGLAYRLRGKGLEIKSVLQNGEEAKRKLSRAFKKLWTEPDYLKKMEYKNKMASEYMKKNNPAKKKENKVKHSKFMKELWMGIDFITNHSGKNHKNWIGDNVGYVGVHNYVRRYKPKLSFCEFCNQEKKLDLANISGFYKRNFKDYLWLCRKCHIAYDKSKRIALINNSGIMQ